MSRRKTVKINFDFLKVRIKEKCRSNVVFCEQMGRPNQNSWVSDWKRDRNLPSPEEAARMCAILQVTPEEILTEQADIELVQSLIDSQKEKPAHNVDELDEVTKKLFKFIEEGTDAERQQVSDYIEFLMSKRDKQ